MPKRETLTPVIGRHSYEIEIAGHILTVIAQMDTAGEIVADSRIPLALSRLLYHMKNINSELLPIGITPLSYLLGDNTKWGVLQRAAFCHAYEALKIMAGKLDQL